jgi:hypothetical protein
MRKKIANGIKLPDRLKKKPGPKRESRISDADFELQTGQANVNVANKVRAKERASFIRLELN